MRSRLLYQPREARLAPPPPSGAWLVCTAILFVAGGPEPRADDRLRAGFETDTRMSADTLRLQIEAPEVVVPGEAVPVLLRVENVSGGTLDLYLRGRTIAFDLVVSRADGSVVWRLLEGEVIPAILRIETLPPGAALELRGMWDQRDNAGEEVRPGSYTVRGELLTEDVPLSTPEGLVRIELP